MADQVKKNTLEIFKEKASRALRRRKSFRTFTMQFPSFANDEDGEPLEIKFKALSDEEINEVVAYEGEQANDSDKYAVYIASVEPSLKDLALELQKQGEINTPLEIMSMFELHEILEASSIIMKESGVLSDKKVTLKDRALDNLKNS